MLRKNRNNGFNRFNARRRLSFESGERDVGVIAGLAISFVLIAGGMAMSGKASLFFDFPSILIVFGGTFGATLVNFSPDEMLGAVRSLRGSLRAPSIAPAQRIGELVRIAHAVKTQGLLYLETEAHSTTDPFFRMALELAVDGQATDEIRRILELETRAAHDRAIRSVQVFETMGTYAPALGLIGTLIGLIQMLSALSNPGAVGPAMATALITTFYGAIFANIVLLPLAGKLRNRYEEGVLLKALTIEGIVSIARQENVVVLEQRLQGFTLSLASSAAVGA